MSSAPTMTPEEMVAFVKEYLKKACDQLFSGPVDMETVLANLHSALQRLSPKKMNDRRRGDMEHAIDVLSEVCALEWAPSGMEEGYNPHDRIRGLADWVIDYWNSRFRGNGAAGVIVSLEHQYRHGQLAEDWQFVRTGKYKVELLYTLKVSIPCIKLDLVV